MIYVNAGYLFSLNHARLVVLLATLYSIYSVKVRVGWPGVLLSINLAFFSNDVLSYLLHCCDNVNESSDSTEQKGSESLTGDEYFGDCEFASPCEEPEKVLPCKSSNKLPASSSIIDEKKELSTRKVIREEATSLDEMKRIMSCTDHYGALGFPRHKKIDATALRKEYRKKVFCLFFFPFCVEFRNTHTHTHITKENLQSAAADRLVTVLSVATTCLLCLIKCLFILLSES